VEDATYGRSTAEHDAMALESGDERHAAMAAVRIERMFDEFDQNAAMAHGWCLNQYGDGMVGIVRDDDSDAFETSDQAHEHVALGAVISPDADYRHLCAQAVVIESASIAARDALSVDEED
jgi:hypothetical protein